MKTIYEDKDILIIDKPAGVEMADFTARSLGEGQPAHRLDKDTSGLLVIAKNQQALANLQAQFKNRQVKKEYTALVFGEMKPEAGEIVTDIIRDPSRRVPFKTVGVPSGLERGKPRVAKTMWEVIDQLKINNYPLSILNLKIITGRTHQIRVHMKYLGYPIVGDMVYCTKASKRFSKAIGLQRQFLHAWKIQFKHPATDKVMTFESNLPEDLRRIMNHEL